jgi:heme A synthase
MFLVLIQVIIGSRFRESLEKILSDNPLLPDYSLISMAGPYKYIHPGLGIIFLIVAILVAYKLLGKNQQPSSIVWQSIWTMVGLAVIQSFLGILMMSIGVKPVLQVLHLWVASLIWGIIFITAGAAGQYRRSQ